MRKLLGITVAAVMPFTLAGALLTPRGVTVSLPDQAFEGLDETTVVAPGPADPGPDERQGSPDLYGNPVSDAVAKYKFDATGGLYELHSPETELPRLGSPKS